MAGNLTARKVTTAKTGKYADGNNLYLVVSQSGSRNGFCVSHGAAKPSRWGSEARQACRCPARGRRP